MSILLAITRRGESSRSARLGALASSAPAPGRPPLRRGCTSLAAALAVVAALGGAGSASAAPTLERVWGTYYGGDSPESPLGGGLDAEGNFYAIGNAYGVTGLATPGAHKTAPELADMYLAKFDPEGALVWATYFGGQGQDKGWGFAVGPDAVVLVGQTNSTSGLATPGALQDTFGGGRGDDGFVASFTLAGALKWSTYIGSSSPFEEARGAAFDADGSVYVVGRAGGPVPGLGTPGTHQPAHGGDSDGYLVKLTPQGEVAWGTYYGGAEGAALDKVSLNALGELYAAGTAFQPSSAIAGPGAHQPEHGGQDDSFLVRFNLDGTRVWGTFYGGEKQDLFSRVLALPQGGALLAGTTLSAANIATPDAHQPAKTGGSDAFLARFDAAGTRQWGTYFGGPWDEYLGGLAVDPGGAVYMCGSTRSVSGIATANGYSLEIQGSVDAFLAKLTPGGALQWGTYFGGVERDFCSSLAVDALYRVHMSGSSNSLDGIATPGAHDEVKGMWSDDHILVRFTQPIGLACAGPEDCGGGPCVDGVCCDGECGGGADDCQACSVRAGAAVDGTCTFLAPDVLCRPSAGSCDAAEHCPGDAGTCPDDAPLPDGASCDEGVCQAGTCVPEESTGDATTGDATTGDATTGDATTGDATTGDADTTGGSATGSTSSDEPTTTRAPASTGDSPTPGSTGDPDGEDDADTGTGAPQAGDPAGCGCRGDAGGAALGSPLLLLFASRRRRRAAGSRGLDRSP